MPHRLVPHKRMMMAGPAPAAPRCANACPVTSGTRCYSVRSTSRLQHKGMHDLYNPPLRLGSKSALRVISPRCIINLQFFHQDHRTTCADRATVPTLILARIDSEPGTIPGYHSATANRTSPNRNPVRLSGPRCHVKRAHFDSTLSLLLFKSVSSACLSHWAARYMDISASAR